MKHISKINRQPIKERKDDPVFKKRTADVINFLFNSLKLIFPAWRNSIKSLNEENEIKKHWLKALVKANITTIEQIEKGLTEAEKLDQPFWPSVGQFVKWCNPKGRVNEKMYEKFTYALPEKTREEYQNIGNKRMTTLKKQLDN